MESIFETINVKLTGARILQHNARLADPEDPIVRAMKPITAKRSKKTDADLIALRHLEIKGGLYWRDGVGVYLPNDWLEGAITDAARKKRQGKVVQAGVQVLEPMLALDYEGRENINSVDDIVADRSFCFTKSVDVNGSRVPRSRPIFREWSVTATVAFDPELLNRDQIIEYLHTAGSRIGMGDWRPKFGRFTVEVL
jgi:hypothetical protein